MRNISQILKDGRHELMPECDGDDAEGETWCHEGADEADESGSADNEEECVFWIG